MTVATQHMTELLLQQGPFKIQLEPLKLRQPHPGHQAAYWIRVQFPYHRQPLCRLKVEITTDEPIMLPTINKQVIHDFDETFVAIVSVYELREIVAEKLRTLLQVRKKLIERGWVASRVCRDYYDLWSILQLEGQMGGKIPELLSQKCKIRQVTFNDPTDFLSPDLLIRRVNNGAAPTPVCTNAKCRTVLMEIRPDLPCRLIVRLSIIINPLILTHFSEIGGLSSLHQPDFVFRQPYLCTRSSFYSQ
jgi:hypothetical protein